MQTTQPFGEQILEVLLIAERGETLACGLEGRTAGGSAVEVAQGLMSLDGKIPGEALGHGHRHRIKTFDARPVEECPIVSVHALRDQGLDPERTTRQGALLVPGVVGLGENAELEFVMDLARLVVELADDGRIRKLLEGDIEIFQIVPALAHAGEAREFALAEGKLANDRKAFFGDLAEDGLQRPEAF